MPTASQHRSKAERNREFLETIPVADHPEWSATVAFYVAVHRVEQLRAVLGHGDSREHADRLDYILYEHASVHTDFKQLYDVSRIARYGPRSAFFQHFSAEDVTDRIIGRWLASVETYAAERIAAASSK